VGIINSAQPYAELRITRVRLDAMLEMLKSNYGSRALEAVEFAVLDIPDEHAPFSLGE
jgi:hypothetical protein